MWQMNSRSGSGAQYTVSYGTLHNTHCQTQIKPLIGPVVLVLANGLSQALFEAHREDMPVLAAMKGPAAVIALNTHVRPGAC